VEPIVYYLDRGAPEPIRSALMEGAQWWNQAFEAAGYQNAFQVKLLPEDADPMDARYNLIQWVHRSTRGWSYGSAVTDPRTGEIIKGHVTLGSLRVRQDFLIAEGLLAPYEEGKPISPAMQELALARWRQLSAHEVGHTLGLAHNYAASTKGRASVMDYPHPLVKLNGEGAPDLSEAYASGIGEWDKVAIAYGYQAEAVAKLVGGLNYSYALRGDGQKSTEMIPAPEQHRALEALLRTLRPEVLALPERILQLIPPRPYGYNRNRETFNIRTGLTFDPLAAAETAAGMMVGLILHPERAARLIEYHGRDNIFPGLGEVMDKLINTTWKSPPGSGYHAEIQRVIDNVVLYHLMSLANHDAAAAQARALAWLKLDELKNWLEQQLQTTQAESIRAHYLFAVSQINQFQLNPKQMNLTAPVEPPAGPPIGSDDWAVCGFDFR
jgi:hypothetical protein